jgi:putative PIN family toxin of toxin-antitoxin system
LRAVLDTNILVSAFNFPGGAPETVYRLALEDRIESVTSLPLLAELGRVLAEKFEWDPSRVEEAVAQVAEAATVVHPQERVRVVREDPADDRVLEAAVAGAAEVIVSGDRHLLRLRSWRGIRIVKAAAFLSEFE